MSCGVWFGRNEMKCMSAGGLLAEAGDERLHSLSVGHIPWGL